MKALFLEVSWEVQTLESNVKSSCLVDLDLMGQDLGKTMFAVFDGVIRGIIGNPTRNEARGRLSFHVFEAHRTSVVTDGHMGPAEAWEGFQGDFWTLNDNNQLEKGLLGGK